MRRMYTRTNRMREGVFRFGQNFTYNNVKYFLRRHPYAKFYAKEIIHEALSKFNLVKPQTNGQKIQNNRRILDKAYEHYRELKRGIGLSRAYGKAYFQFFKVNGELVFRAFEPENYEAWYNEAGNVEKVEAVVQVHGVSSEQLQTWEGEALEVGYELINEQTDVWNEPISELEAIWDVLYAIYMLVSHSAYFVARTGAGLKKLFVPETALDQDSDLANDLAASMRDFGAAHDVMVIPKTINGMEVEFEIETTKDNTKWTELLEIYLMQLIPLTGIPMSTWKGLVPGQLEAGKINEESFHDVLRDLRERYEPVKKWFLETLASFHSLQIVNNYEIDYSKRDQLSEDEKMLFLQKQLTAVKQLQNLGIDKKKAFEMAGMEVPDENFAEEQSMDEGQFGFSGQNVPNEPRQREDDEEGRTRGQTEEEDD